ncbi:hypothetical protein ACIF9R_34320 [Streptomyces sp. NPDC086080]|uniref:hypothetical protein n=1 Tax=Streptomyces sp. NPDC086080 TaxID=3365748 RepID=UPI0037D3E25C
MVAATPAAHDVEITAEALQDDLARLELQKQALERELAAVVAHVDSVQRALGALRVLLRAPAARPAPAADPVPAGPAEPRRVPAPVAETSSAPDPDHTARTPVPTPDPVPAPGPPAGTEGPTKYGRLTEQILDYFATVGDVDVRARDVAAALGRDTDSGAINAVRSTLDRLVGTSRVRRTGRGLYRAGRS